MAATTSTNKFVETIQQTYYSEFGSEFGQTIDVFSSPSLRTIISGTIAPLLSSSPKAVGTTGFNNYPSQSNCESKPSGHQYDYKTMKCQCGKEYQP